MAFRRRPAKAAAKPAKVAKPAKAAAPAKAKPRQDRQDREEGDEEELSARPRAEADVAAQFWSLGSGDL